jgi:ketosteroid isomerase-like protein
MVDLESALAKLQASYISAVYKRDSEAFVRLYDPAVRVFDAWGAWEYIGTEPWRRALEGLFTAHEDETVKVTFTDTECHGTLGSAFASTMVKYAWISADGEEVRSMEHRLTWGLRTTGDVLRILHEHTSYPVGFEDMKAILQRKASA